MNRAANYQNRPYEYDEKEQNPVTTHSEINKARYIRSVLNSQIVKINLTCIAGFKNKSDFNYDVYFFHFVKVMKLREGN